ncbi:MAG: formamidopyrimidine-DNA glycosylase [Candidatus Tyloplasma litorale]|nr:MAG: formamidopyrimidine-DNA glycosylase [Mycoplasmatales bacterium]
MPELPEVETVRRYLFNNIIDWKIIDFKVSNLKSLRNVDIKEFKQIINQKIKNMNRLAKHLIFELENNYFICHLRMEGKFFIFKNEEEMNKFTNRFHDVLIIYTDKGIILFQDTRRFATIDFFSNKLSYENNPILSEIGREPFNANAEEIYNKLSKKRIAIKTALLDQKIISGLGNIYVDEVLYDVKLHPQTPSNQIDLNKVIEIIDSAKRILLKAIELKGTTIRSYTSSLGVEGEYQKFLKVHQKKNYICQRDNQKIIKIKVGGRVTYFCPGCQKLQEKTKI